MKIKFVIVLALFFVGGWERSYGQEKDKNRERRDSLTKLYRYNVDDLDSLLGLDSLKENKFDFFQEKLDTNTKKEKVKKQCVAIRQYKNLTKVVIDDAKEFLGNNPDNGASLTGYFKGDSLVRIIEWVGLSNKIRQNDFYFNQGNLICVYSVDSMYEYDKKKQTIDYSKLRFFSSGFYCVETEKIITKDVEGKVEEWYNKDAGKQLMNKTKEYKKLLEDKRKTNHQL